MKKSIVVLFSAVLPFAVFADDAKELVSKLDVMQGIKANFSQKVTDQNGKLIQEGSGVIAMHQPDAFYWHLTAPDESLIVAKDNSVWVYNPFAEEVSILDMEDILKASPMALLVHRDEKRWNEYQIDRKGSCFDITPRQGVESAVDTVSVCFANNTLSDIRLTDAQGSTSHFSLSEQAAVTDADESLFQFQIPDGVSIDDQRRQ
ncbi:outer membrane lipoprotein chaperone LolA [Shewanella amazonensis]|uniref:Outer-membrane lipoprotein carrier protein n=1 Tax=Shewanella amazonensis (strain ATCC BAA-1098 / SB2B) TaxID=326297 RepID=LOLA_SHEAM|nr:outer membrane lipoprotein chaperone LolA [Shewanella amazonensis]A1S6H2.1 RecName: Full=Outer-membrane lipoprotein carrier protein; Flags: Precursor [Shewanella amazonensis SB2B]ABL99978.1 outer membrane lipoprotein carrier protein LolA [Shewanella amazonensis SB2B]